MGGIPQYFTSLGVVLDCSQSVFLLKYLISDYEERLFSLKENGTRHSLNFSTRPAPFCTRGDLTLVLVTLKKPAASRLVLCVHFLLFSPSHVFVHLCV